MNVAQLNLIFELMSAAHAAGFPLWLESGWAVDARLGRVTREHDDIDLAVPAERIADFKTILGRIGTTDEEDTEYGFLPLCHNA